MTAQAQWWPARTALEMLEQYYGPEYAPQDIVERCSNGTMYARAAIFIDREITSKQDAERGDYSFADAIERKLEHEIPNTFWHPAHATPGISETTSEERIYADWAVGEFRREYKCKKTPQTYYEREACGVEFTGPILSTLAELLASSKELRAPENKGGRPASRHGDAIAAATLKLAGLAEAELRRFTNASLAVELADYYRDAGEHPPNQRNLENYAAGILRVLRARQT